MAFLGFVNVYCLRVNLSVGLVAMVNDTDTSKNTSDEEACAGPDSGQNTTVKVVYKYINQKNSKPFLYKNM